MSVAPTSLAKSTRSPEKERTGVEGSSPTISRIMPILSATEKSGVFSSFSRIATTTRRPVARRARGYPGARRSGDRRSRDRGRRARSSVSASLCARSTQPFGEQIIGGHGQEEGQARKKRHPPRLFDVGGRGRQDSTPRRGGRRQAHSEERQRRLREDRPRDAESGGDEQRRENIGEQVAQQDARCRSAGDLRRARVVETLRLQDLGAGVARVSGPGRQPDRQNDRGGRGRKEGRESEQEEEHGKTEYDLDEPRPKEADGAPQIPRQ